MSILILMLAATITATIQETIQDAVEQRRQRVKWARRRARQHTFN